MPRVGNGKHAPAAAKAATMKWLREKEQLKTSTPVELFGAATAELPRDELQYLIWLMMSCYELDGLLSRPKAGCDESGAARTLLQAGKCSGSPMRSVP